MNFLKKKHLYGLIVLSTLILTGCSSDVPQEPNTQQIFLGQYAMEIGENFVVQSVDQIVDPRVAGKIQSIYASASHTGYKENLIVSQDVLAPNITLEDYAQASFQAIGETRRNTKLLRTSTTSFTCQALTSALYVQSFELDRLGEDNTHTQTLYFVQGYVLQGKSVIIMSFNTSNQKNVSILESYINSISCARS